MSGVGSGSGGNAGEPGGFGGGGGGGHYQDAGGNGGFGGGGGSGGFGGLRTLQFGGNGGNGGFGSGGGAGGMGGYFEMCYNYYCGCGYVGCGYWTDLSRDNGTGGFGGGSPGGGLGAGAAIFAKDCNLTLTNVAFTQNNSSGGTGANPGQGKAGAIFICTNAEDTTCTATVTTNSCGVTFSSNTATNAGTTDTDNADTFQVNRTNLMKSCAAAPVAVTNAPSVITAASARLSGTINPNGAFTGASFELGPTVSYGQNLVATPSSIAATAATTNVSADKVGLNCNTTYLYRVKAVSNAGTGLGLDQSFNTAACVCGDADGNNIVNIVDALSIARYVVNLPPPPSINITAADVDSNGQIVIADALNIAKFAVGLVVSGTCLSQ